MDVFSCMRDREDGCASVTGSPRWNCGDSSFSQNNHRRCVEWKQVYFGWQEAGWRVKPQWETEAPYSAYFCFPGMLLNFGCFMCFLSWEGWKILIKKFVYFFCLQYFFVVKPIERAIKNDIAEGVMVQEGLWVWPISAIMKLEFC